MHLILQWDPNIETINSPYFPVIINDDILGKECFTNEWTYKLCQGIKYLFWIELEFQSNEEQFPDVDYLRRVKKSKNETYFINSLLFNCSTFVCWSGLRSGSDDSITDRSGQFDLLITQWNIAFFC